MKSNSQPYTFIWVIDQFGSPSKTLKNYNNDIITSKGFNLEFWDIRALHKKWFKENPNFVYEDKDLFIIQFSALREIEREFERLKEDGVKVAFLLSGKIGFWNKAFIRLLEKNQFPYFIRRNRTSFFQGDFNISSSKNVINSRTKRLINDLFSWVINHPIIALGIKGPEQIFAGTKFDLEHINYPYKPAQVTYTHTKDYDQYLITKDKISNAGDNAIVFIDQFLPFHPETKSLGIDPTIFYSTIIQFLQLLSKEKNKEIIFAAHPASDPELMRKYVPQELLVYYKTTEMVSNCYCAISFNSTAIMNAFIASRPFVLLKFNEIIPQSFNNITDYLEGLFQTKSIDIAKPYTIDGFDNVIAEQQTNREMLFNNYIKHPGTPELTEFTIICNKIKQHLNSSVSIK